MRSRSIVGSNSAFKKDEKKHKTLRLLGGQTITLPQRERFNEEVESAIQESKERHAPGTLTHKAINSLGKDKALSGQPSKSKLESSKKTNTAKELQMFFKKGEEDIRSKYSTLSKQSKKISFKDKLYNQLDRKRNESVNSQPELPDEAPNQEQLESILGEKKEGEDDNFKESRQTVDSSRHIDDDQFKTLADEDLVSQTPTDQLAAEYKKLMEEFKHVSEGNRQLEMEIENLKQAE